MNTKFENSWTGSQFALIRILGGLYLACMFLWLSSLTMNPPEQTFTFSEPSTRYLGNLVILDIYPLFALLSLFAATASVLLMLGYYIRACATFLLCGLAAFVNVGLVDTSLDLVSSAILLVVLLLVPEKTLFSMGSGDEPLEELDTWHIPDGLWEALWILFGGLLLTFGLSSLLFLPDGVYLVANELNPILAKHSALLFPLMVAQITCGVLVVLACVWRARLRFPAWSIIACVLIMMQIRSCIVASEDFQLSGAFTILLFLLLDPRWFPQRRAEQSERVFYDGDCGLCHGFVRFILLEDRNGLFVLSPLQGESIKKHLEASVIDGLPDSVVVQRSDGEILLKSEAALHVLATLGGVWRPIAIPLKLLPRNIRDFFYDCIARIRRYITQPPERACPLLPPHLNGRIES